METDHPGVVQLRTLGALELLDAEGRPAQRVLAQPKRVAFFVYLALAEPTGFRRKDLLLALFWPEQDQSSAANNLRKTLHFLRGELGSSLLLRRGSEEIGVDWDRFRVDAVEMESALGEARWREAMALYRGELLPGFHIDGAAEFHRWLEIRRRRLLRGAELACWRLCERHRAEGASLEAVRWAHRAAEIAPLEERTARRLITTLQELGDRSAALRAYRRFARLLQEELDLEPSLGTRALVDPTVDADGRDGDEERSA